MLQIPSLKELFTLDLKQVDWKRTVLLVLLILAVASSLWQYFMPQIRTITETRFHPVPVISGTAKIDRVYVACPERGIVTLDKAEVARKLDIDFLQGGDISSAKESEKLTPEVNSPSPEGSNLQVTATADLPESDNGYEEISVIDTASGESQIMAREKESPWWQFRNDAAVGVKYGFNQHLMLITDVYGKWDFLRIKNLYLGVSGDVSTGGDAKLQLGGEYRW